MSMVLLTVFSVRCSGVQPKSGGMPKVINGEAGSLLRPAKVLPAFQLTDHRGELFNNDSLKGGWSLLFMGFTSCGHLCPPTLYKMSLIAEQSVEPLKIVFISVDPGRDSIETLGAYIPQYGDTAVAATGSSEQLDAIVGGFGATWKVIDEPGNYDVEHSPAVYLVDPEGRFAGIFSPPLNAEKMLTDINGYIGSE